MTLGLSREETLSGAEAVRCAEVPRSVLPLESQNPGRVPQSRIQPDRRRCGGFRAPVAVAPIPGKPTETGLKKAMAATSEHTNEDRANEPPAKEARAKEAAVSAPKSPFWAGSPALLYAVVGAQVLWLAATSAGRWGEEGYMEESLWSSPYVLAKRLELTTSWIT